MKIKLYVFWEQFDWEDEGRFGFWDIKVNENKNRMFLREVDCYVADEDMPSKLTRDQMVRMKVSALESERQAILAETHQKVAMINEKIQQLSALKNLKEPA